MFNRKSSYALNKKDPNAIVYMDANEAIIRLTREDFASEEEFLKWKSLSDADYHASEKEDHVYANHTLALDELSEEAASIPAADICMEQAHDRVAEIRRSTQKVTQIRKHLTDTQFRRMWMYFVDGMTIDEIGKVEGVSHQATTPLVCCRPPRLPKRGTGCMTIQHWHGCNRFCCFGSWNFRSRISNGS